MAFFSQASAILAHPYLLDDTHVPDHLLGRAEQRRLLAECVAPALAGSRPINAWVFGPSGSGKTSTVRHVLAEVQQQRALTCAYVSCWDACTGYAVVDRLVRDLRILGADAQSLSLKLEQLAKRISAKPSIIVVDEIDRAAPKERSAILSALLSIERAGLIVVSYSQKPFLELDSRIRSRLHPALVEFLGYTPAELLEIVDRRAQFALVQGAWDAVLLAKIAEMSDGNARVALQALRLAAYHAEHDRSTAILDRHLDTSLDALHQLKQQSVLDTLTPHHRLIYQLVLAAQQIASVDLRRSYEQACKEQRQIPIAERTYLEYVKKLELVGLVRSEWQVAGGRKRMFQPTK